jgi:heat shock protein HtpX
MRRRHPFAIRVFLFVLTNLAVLAVFALVLWALRAAGLFDFTQTGYSYGALLTFAAIFGFGGALFSLAISKWVAKRMTRARVIERPSNETEMWLLETVRQLSRRSGIKMPEVAIYPSNDMNAFATGARRNHALLAVSTGLLARMNREEVEAVLGHEVSHAANGDMITLTLIQGVLNTFVIFLSRIVGTVVDRAIFRTERGHGPGYLLTVIVTQLALGVLASIVIFWFARRRELRADSGSAELLGPGPMISALERLKGSHGPAQLPDSVKSFGIRGGAGHGLRRLFMSHPPLEERIARLEGMWGRA